MPAVATVQPSLRTQWWSGAQYSTAAAVTHTVRQHLLQAALAVAGPVMIHDAVSLVHTTQTCLFLPFYLR